MLTDKSLYDSHIIYIPVPYEGTVSGGKGASKGPSAIIDAIEQLEDYDRFLDTVTCNSVNIFLEEPLSVNGLEPHNMVKSVYEKTMEILNLNKFPLLFGGEHSISIGSIQAVKAKYSDLTVFQIDAHGDLRDDDSDYKSQDISKYAHCCVMRRAVEMGCRIVQAGIRELYSGEIDYIRKNNLTERVFQCPVRVPVGDIISVIDTDYVYLTIDVDGFDPSVMPETGTPVAGGLDWYFVIDLLKELFLKKNVVASDITEVSPFLPNNMTAKNAVQLAYMIAGLKFLKK